MNRFRLQQEVRLGRTAMLVLGLVATLSMPVLRVRAQSTDRAEEAGVAAEQAGRLREALDHYVAALQTLEENPSPDAEQRLRERIIKVALRLDPRPAMPEQAREHFLRARAMVKVARTEDDFWLAALSFRKASFLAPWVPEIYFNLGMTSEKANNYFLAGRALTLYLAAAPGALDRDQVQEKIYELEVKDTRQHVADALERLAGEWNVWACGLQSGGCTVDEMQEGGHLTPLYTLEERGDTKSYNYVFAFSFPGDGTAVMPRLPVPACSAEVRGVPDPANFYDIRWWMSGEEIYGTDLYWKDSLVIACDGPPAHKIHYAIEFLGAKPRKKYHFIVFRRLP